MTPVLSANPKDKMDSSWHPYLLPEFDKPYMQALKKFLYQETKEGRKIYPPASLTFNALKLTSLPNTNVLILGQDPYINPGQAMGLSFSVPNGTRFPPSLTNICKELKEDLDLPYPTSGDLTPWALQGCLLLNSVLSVRPGESNSHADKGWEHFTDHVIQTVSDQQENTVFLLLGAYAQKKSHLINQDKHCVIETPHPSPLSAYRGFFGSKPFSRTNTYLVEHSKKPINWQLP
jgi:uracil-DNA glycosylase